MTNNTIQITQLHNKKNKNTSSRIEYFKKQQPEKSKNYIYTNFYISRQIKNILTRNQLPINKQLPINIIKNDDIYEFINEKLVNNYKIFNLLLVILKENIDKINEVKKKISGTLTNKLRGTFGLKKKINNSKKKEYENVIKHLEHSKKNIIKVFIKFINNDYKKVLDEIVKNLEETKNKIVKNLESKKINNQSNQQPTQSTTNLINNQSNSTTNPINNQSNSTTNQIQQPNKFNNQTKSTTNQIQQPNKIKMNPMKIKKNLSINPFNQFE
jgi:hypothetical protein